MFNNRRLLFREPDRPPVLPPLPISFAGAVEREMIDRMRRSIPPIEEYLLYRIDKFNIGELL